MIANLSVFPLHAVVLLVVVGGGLALWISALVSISRRALAPAVRGLWYLGVFVAPFLGPILWFAVGRGPAGQRAQL